MSHLYKALEECVDAWRKAHYECESYPAIREILEFATAEDGSRPYLRSAQLRALETYWFLRLKLDTPTVPELYETLFPKLGDRREAMGISRQVFESVDYDFTALCETLRTDDAFVRQHRLESLRETFELEYPSYILALAMGAGKTILMGAIAATEFALGQEYPEGPFVHNALIFAPGTTIIESLRELADVPYHRIMPPRLYKPFATTFKLTFTRDGEKELPVVWGSDWNLIVTNTEKIRIQKKTARGQARNQLDLMLEADQDKDAEIANLRLQAIASLPNLAVFSDEAHHTYGQKLLGKWQRDRESGEQIFMPQGIKKVRRTVDFLARETNLRVVVNTTGTPYFERQPLRDVVVWYSLGEGIADGVLKELANNIQVFDLDEDQTDYLVERIVSDFIADYWYKTLPDGSPARLALYFPNTDSLAALRPAVESTLAAQGLDASCVLAVHSNSDKDTKRELYRLTTDPSSPYRIVMLVNMGTEGWNCPSLFACGLVRKLKSSNNFVLQAATRCLRQVPGNTTPARVYVSKGNRAILQKQLEETYGTTLDDLNREQTERVEQRIEIKKPDIPPLRITKKIRRYKRKAAANDISTLHLRVPSEIKEPRGQISTWTLKETPKGKVQMKRVDGGEDILTFGTTRYSLYGAAAELAAHYHLPMASMLTVLRQAYGSDGEIPEYHFQSLREQIEKHTGHYEEHWEEIDIALALIKPDGFEKRTRAGVPVYTARVSFAKDRAHLYKTADELVDTTLAREKSFHYEGYNFDSGPELSYLERVLALVAEHPDDIEGVWFTGGLTDPGKTELFAEYIGEDGRWHRYTPDFVIARKDGKHLIVEVKKDTLRATIEEDIARHERDEPALSAEGRKAIALNRWETLNPERLSYQLVFANDTVPDEALDSARAFIAGENAA